MFLVLWLLVNSKDRVPVWISNTKSQRCRPAIRFSLPHPEIWAYYSSHPGKRRSPHTRFQNDKMDEHKKPTVSIIQPNKAVLHDVRKFPETSVITPVSPDTSQFESQLPPPPAYHIFNRSRKLELVFIVSLAAIFSPLSYNIYFPALGDVSRVSLIHSPLPSLDQLGLLRC